MAIVTENPLPYATLVDDYAVLPAVDVRGQRILTLYVEYTPGIAAYESSSDGRLSLLPEAALALEGPNGVSQPDEASWFAVGVLDGTLGTSEATSPVPILSPTYAARLAYASELIFQGTFADEGAEEFFPAKFTLLYDVSAYSWFRFRVADRGAQDSTAKIYYTLQR